MKLIQVILLIFLAVFIAYSDPYGIMDTEPQGKQKKSPPVDTLKTNAGGQGQSLKIEFQKGEAHNHPLFAIWVEDPDGKYVQTLYVSKSIATSIFNYGEKREGTWTEGVVRRPAALPYWSHKRGVKASDGLYMPLPEDPVPDAYTGATPLNDFVLETRLDHPATEPFYVLLEINQPWDWNTFWTNNKFPEDEEYKTSSQPAVVYRALITPKNKRGKVSMELIGHSHYSGKDGSLEEDVSTLTTAREIVEKIQVTLND